MIPSVMAVNQAPKRPEIIPLPPPCLTSRLMFSFKNVTIPKNVQLCLINPENILTKVFGIIMMLFGRIFVFFLFIIVFLPIDDMFAQCGPQCFKVVLVILWWVLKDLWESFWLAGWSCEHPPLSQVSLSLWYARFLKRQKQLCILSITDRCHWVCF